MKKSSWRRLVAHASSPRHNGRNPILIIPSRPNYDSQNRSWTRLRDDAPVSNAPAQSWSHAAMCRRTIKRYGVQTAAKATPKVMCDCGAAIAEVLRYLIAPQIFRPGRKDFLRELPVGKSELRCPPWSMKSILPLERVPRLHLLLGSACANPRLMIPDRHRSRV